MTKRRPPVTAGPERVEVLEYTDPYCTWCWGSEPVLRRIQELYGGQVLIRFVMGGLVADIRDFYDPLNDIGGSNWFRQVAEHWKDASRRHGMPVDEQVFYDIKDEFRSTYPACIAYKSAEFQDGEKAKRFLRRMREAAAAERMAIHRLEVQAALARETGLDRERFLRDIEGGRAEQAFREDIRDCREKGISGFPTFVLTGSNAQEIILHGYTFFSRFDAALQRVSDGNLSPRPIQDDDEGILAFIRKYGKVAQKEVAEVFSLTMDSAAERLRQMVGQGVIQEQKAGNGFFYHGYHGSADDRPLTQKP